MRSARTCELLGTLGIRPSHSRPRASNDNHYIESLFKTVKYPLEFPERFRSLEQARTFANSFFEDYNQRHLHSDLNWFTPGSVHDGTAANTGPAPASTRGLLPPPPERSHKPPVIARPPTQHGSTNQTKAQNCHRQLALFRVPAPAGSFVVEARRLCSGIARTWLDVMQRRGVIQQANGYIRQKCSKVCLLDEVSPVGDSGNPLVMRLSRHPRRMNWLAGSAAAVWSYQSP
jgi:hypothetical protein